MGSDLHFNPPPPDDLPTQVRHLIESREELLRENARLRARIAELEASVRGFKLVIRAMEQA